MNKKNRIITLLLAVIIILIGLVVMQKYKLSFEQGKDQLKPQKPISEQKLASKTPAEALERLKQGNMRFVHEDVKEADYSVLVDKSANVQHPAAIVLSCIDSRVPPEIVFDQAIGNIFVSRVAGEVISPDIIAGMEYATAVTGSKLIVILGHGNCGAVKAACKQVKLGNITGLLDKIQPAVTETAQQFPGRTCKELEYVNQIAINNVKNIVAEIPKQSAIIKGLMDQGQVEIVGAMYDIDSGKVEFFEPEA